MSNTLPEWWPEALEGLRAMVREELAAQIEEQSKRYKASLETIGPVPRIQWMVREEVSAALLAAGPIMADAEYRNRIFEAVKEKPTEELAEEEPAPTGAIS